MNRRKEGAGMYGLTTMIKVILTSPFAIAKQSGDAREET